MTHTKYIIRTAVANLDRYGWVLRHLDFKACGATIAYVSESRRVVGLRGLGDINDAVGLLPQKAVATITNEDAYELAKLKEWWPSIKQIFSVTERDAAGSLKVWE